MNNLQSIWVDNLWVAVKTKLSNKDNRYVHNVFMKTYIFMKTIFIYGKIKYLNNLITSVLMNF